MSVSLEKPRRKPHIWTDADDDIVRSNYCGTNKSALWIAQKIGCSLWSVKGRVYRLGLALKRSPDWTEKELEKLAVLIHQYPVLSVARKLHRSPNAVRVKATQLKMGLRIRDGWYTKKEVCEILGLNHHRVQRLIDDGKLKAAWHTEREPQKNGMAPWRIMEEDIRDFIRRYPEELLGRNVDIVQIVHILSG